MDRKDLTGQSFFSVPRMSRYVQEAREKQEMKLRASREVWAMHLLERV